MGTRPWGVYLWPGLPQLWKHGDWVHLATATGFAMLLNLAILSTFLWSELLAPEARSLAWLAVVVVWVGAAVFSVQWSGGQPQGTPVQDDRFPEAQDHYLKGNWFEAEHLLGGQLRRNPRDVESRLMLATLLRHNGRCEEAAWHLDRLQRAEGSEQWGLEIRREREMLAKAQQREVESPEEPADTAAAERGGLLKDAA